MKNWIWTFVVVGVATLVGALVDPKPKSMFSVLKIGQFVKLIDHGSACSIGFVEPEVSLVYMVIEIGEDYVVVLDIAGVKETVMPVYSVKGIEKVRVQVE